jgi:hypothetical protein
VILVPCWQACQGSASSLSDRCKRHVQDALFVEIRRDVSDRPGDLALVQMALFETWKQHKPQKSSLLEAYTKVGGVSGALAHAAEEVRSNMLDAKQQDLVEPVFVRLINLGDTGGATRRVARIHEFHDALGDLVRMLSEERCSRLLLLGTDQVEICHEQLITQWPWLQSRITESAVYVRRLSRLIEKVSEWKRADYKNRDQYLATGAELEVFENLGGQHGDWLSPTEAEYVTASKNARRREERRRVWQFRGLAASSLLLFMATLVATLFYLSASDDARRDVANESRALSALSRAALEDGHPNQAAKLALAAWSREAVESHFRLESTLQNLSRALSTGWRSLTAWPQDVHDQHFLETTLQNLSRAMTAGRLYSHQWQ